MVSRISYLLHTSLCPARTDPGRVTTPSVPPALCRLDHRCSALGLLLQPSLRESELGLPSVQVSARASTGGGLPRCADAADRHLLARLHLVPVHPLGRPDDVGSSAGDVSHLVVPSSDVLHQSVHRFWRGHTLNRPLIMFCPRLSRHLPVRSSNRSGCQHGRPVARSVCSFIVMLPSCCADLVCPPFQPSPAGAGFPLFAKQMYVALNPRFAGLVLGCVCIALMPIPFVFL